VAVRQERDRIASAALWPGFDPRRIPLAVFDGETTWLFGHPAPPAGFREVAGEPRTWSWRGRHPEVTSTTSADVGGTPTATLLAVGEASTTDLAKTAVHEAFHVFQSQRHPSWGANEMDLFVYPLEDAEALALRRLEFAALRRALAAPDRGEAVRWARAALALRRERFARLPATAAAYERGTELKEGLAQYVEDRAAGGLAERRLPESEFGVDEVRQRSYATGEALAFLLDRFDPGWTGRAESGELRALDDWLEAAIAGLPGSGAEADLGAGTAARVRAQAEVAALRAARAAAKADFLSRPGWTVVVIAEGEPLWPEGFDPWNVQGVGDAAVLHRRFLKLGNATGRIEALDRPALTEPAGAHPLMNGVRRVVFSGFDAKPAVSATGGGVKIAAPGLAAEFRSATVEESGRIVLVTVGRAG
jgi:hypothetical protein